MQQPAEHQDQAKHDFVLELARRQAEARHEAFFAERDRDEELREWREEQAELVAI